jgi:hypothetical protein
MNRLQKTQRPPLWTEENIRIQIIKPKNAAYVITKLVLNTTPEDGMTGAKHVRKQNILKLKWLVVSYCDKTVNSFKF